MDDFEQLLKNQPLRTVPAEWRGEILAEAVAASARKPKAPMSLAQAWLWPSPYAWGALAAVWVVILGLNLASRTAMDRTLPGGPQPSSQEIYAFILERRRMFEGLQPSATAHVTVAPLRAPQKNNTDAGLERRKEETTQFA